MSASKPLLGTRHLIRLALRRDRLVLPIWVLLIGLAPTAAIGTYEQLYPTEIERQSLTASMGANPSLSLLYGPAFDLATPGGFTAWRYGTFIPLFLALACIFTVTRHTRQEEDTGRHELLASAEVGRYAALTASVVLTSLASLITGALIAGSMVGAGLPAAGSLAFGAGTALVGLVFVGVAAVTAQLAEYSRTANGLAVAVLGVIFLLRAVGDAARDISWLSWLSPIGWATQVRAFAGERWWVLGLLVVAAVVLGGAAYALIQRRDVGMGIFATRPGPAFAAPSLRTPFALALRLHRGQLIGWTIGFAVMGALFGSLASGIGGVLGDSEQTRQVLERMGGADAIVDAFLGAIVSILAMVASMYSVQAALRMRSEEIGIRVEPLLATSVGRLRWAGGHLAFVFGGSALLLVVSGALTGLFHGMRVSDVSGQVPKAVGASLAQLPAVWVVAASAVLLFGFLPKFASAAWGLASAFLVISLFGPVVQLSQVVQDISPFTHSPKLPGAAFSSTPLLWLMGVAVVVLGAGLVGFRRRDISTA